MLDFQQKSSGRGLCGRSCQRKWTAEAILQSCTSTQCSFRMICSCECRARCESACLLLRQVLLFEQPPTREIYASSCVLVGLDLGQVRNTWCTNVKILCASVSDLCHWPCLASPPCKGHSHACEQLFVAGLRGPTTGHALTEAFASSST